MFLSSFRMLVRLESEIFVEKPGERIHLDVSGRSIAHNGRDWLYFEVRRDTKPARRPTP